MPVLMNKGDDPRQAAWLFYTDRSTLDELATTAYEKRFDAGRLVVDGNDLEAVAKASGEVPVYLEVTTLVPEDFDLGSIEKAVKEAEAIARATVGQTEQDGQSPENGTATQEVGTTGEAVNAEEGADDESAAGSYEPYEPIEAPEGLRMRIGTTTVAAARSYIVPRSSSGDEPWDAELPGLQMLVSLVSHMREHGGLAPFVVWHVDPQGILRMSPAKTVKPMAGNILKCKL